jgi:hypothetical protein
MLLFLEGVRLIKPVRKMPGSHLSGKVASLYSNWYEEAHEDAPTRCPLTPMSGAPLHVAVPSLT